MNMTMKHRLVRLPACQLELKNEGLTLLISVKKIGREIDVSRHLRAEIEELMGKCFN